MVLVDEAQDFDHPRLELAYAMLQSDRLLPDLARPDRDNFVMAYDVAQNVYRRGGARWNPARRRCAGQDEDRARPQHRLPQELPQHSEILEFAMNFLAGSRDWSSASVDLDDPAALIPPEAAKRSGPHPRLTVCRDLREEAESIASRVMKLLTGGVAVYDIAVLYGCAELQQELQRRSHTGPALLSCARKGLWGPPDQPRQGCRCSGQGAGVDTYRHQGLEFSRVFVGGVNHAQVHDVEAVDQFQATKSQLYAAMTRAMDELEITMSGDGEIGTAMREAECLRRVG